MPSITPIPSTRVSDQLIRRRLLTQLQFDQLGLFRVQNQISTGRRIFAPSDDAPAALRAISLQRLLERKEQVQENLATNQTFLSASDIAIGGVSQVLINVRGLAVSAISDTATKQEREEAASEVFIALTQLIASGNQKFRGRYLFAGAQTHVRPYEQDGDYVRFDGDEQTLQSYSDIGNLFDTNVNGTDVFGGISAAVTGTSDLNPLLTLNTLITDLNGGVGITDGSVRVSDGTNSSVVDISTASTVGDVVGLLERNPPAGRTLTVTLTNTGLNVSLDAGGGGDLTIAEVGGGTTAVDLGILAENNTGTGPVVGTDLDPRLTLTTALDDLGVQATASVPSTGASNDLIFTAVQRGATSLSGDTLNGVEITYVDTGAVTAGSETVAYDGTAVPPTLVIDIDATNSTANQVIAAVAAAATAGTIPFTASPDPAESGNDGTGTVSALGPVTTAGGSGIEFDRTNGLRIENGGATHVVTFNSAQTVEDVLVVLNGSDADVLAAINTAGTGLDIRSRLSGSDFSIGENSGQAATQLGVRTLNLTTRLEDLNFGFGVHTEPGTDLNIRLEDGTLVAIDVDGLTTVGDFINAVNGHADNQVAATRVVASLATVGNGIALTSSTVPPDDGFEFAVLKANGSQAGEDLGLIPIDADQSGPAVAVGTDEVITGRDVNPLEAEGVFTALVRLKDALENEDKLQISRAVELLDKAFETLNFSRAELGSRQQGLDVLQQRLDGEEIELRAALSLEIDTDIVDAISELTSRQVALQASLAITGQISQLTLLNYI